jgi:CheY-like chemotaxis protein
MSARVLVADDEPAITELVATILGFAGFAVMRAHDGAEALRVARESRPDVIFLDVMMPKMDGRDVCRAITRDAVLRGIPVVLFSSADEADVEWRAAGAVAFLQKPFDIRRLPDLVRKLTGRRDGK